MSITDIHEGINLSIPRNWYTHHDNKGKMNKAVKDYTWSSLEILECIMQVLIIGSDSMQYASLSINCSKLYSK